MSVYALVSGWCPQRSEVSIGSRESAATDSARLLLSFMSALKFHLFRYFLVIHFIFISPSHLFMVNDSGI